MTLAPSGSLLPVRVPFWVQLIAWLVGAVACFDGMLDLVAEWSPELATLQFLLMLLAPVFWMFERHRLPLPGKDSPAQAIDVKAWIAAICVGLISFMTCVYVGLYMVDWPPAYHDEYSYLFEARAILMGTFSVPSHAVMPELFDQMHVLNEGRMASRYYPGTGVWMAPFVAWRHPYWGHWLATSIASQFVFWTGYELGRLRVALVSGLVFAISPGIALFGNLLLAHQPTLLGLMFFTWAFTKWMRTQSPYLMFLAGCGLSFAMISRPATAAGYGLPFGIALVSWLFMPPKDPADMTGKKRLIVLASIGLPLIAGWTTMLIYNHSVTGSWLDSPYQLYTQLYTPRHIYGFNNVVRGEAMAGPKVIQAYDRWAKNLTPELAATNIVDRLLASWLWTFDLLPLLMGSIIIVSVLLRVDRRWIPILGSILSLHAIHIPYWYVGIMGWHYVFESAPVWCLLLGLATDLLFSDWHQRGRWAMPGWWTLLLLLSLSGDYLPFQWSHPKSPRKSRIANGIGSIGYPRRQYFDFGRWLEQAISNRPALVLIEIDPDDTHVDYVDNTPGLTGSILRARYIPGVTNLQKVFAAFPDRAIYLCQPKRKTIQLLRDIRDSAEY